MQDYPREPVVTDMADTNTSPNIMIIAGEVSGDMHAAQLVNAVKQHLPDATFFGIGGDEMKDAGVEVHFHVSEMAVMPAGSRMWDRTYSPYGVHDTSATI